ncbi:MAG TPA: VanZ family protein [Candidatus Latescibacteria bacterium]|nr:VanZ family protein [Candidatus Latescibacterota bacterium]HJP32264.1 VanZ family protein [Candidatus Latescibacterota bacterium]
MQEPIPMTPAQPSPLFSSARERRLWAWTLAVVVAIYSTLGLAATLAGALRDRGLIEELLFFCLLLVLATIATQGLSVRPRGLEISVVLGVTAVYLLAFARMTGPVEERTHLVEYAVVAVLVFEALTERASRGRRVPIPALLTVVVASMIGVLDECIQAFLPSRVFDSIDILFNCLAGSMAVVASASLHWARRLTADQRVRRNMRAEPRRVTQ